MTTLSQASRQWASRPSDERFISLTEMQQAAHTRRQASRALVASNRAFQAEPFQALPSGRRGNESPQALSIISRSGESFAPSHWAFGQLCQLADAPAAYLRGLPSHVAADCLNWGLQHKRKVEDVGLLLYRSTAASELHAATGPRYGRIWNADIIDSLVRRFGDGVSGDWRVPGEFGKRTPVTRENTTLYAGDRDMFIFLADEDHRIEVPHRRHGASGSLARGFFLWNSEVGSKSFGIGTFLFDYVCCNRMVWGAQDFRQITIRHTSGAPDRWLEEMAPALHAYAEGSSAGISSAIADAQAHRLDSPEDFLAKRFSKRRAEQMLAAHMLEEERPVETLWDASVAATAFARGIEWQDDRVAIEREAGAMLRIEAKPLAALL